MALRAVRAEEETCLGVFRVLCARLVRSQIHPPLGSQASSAGTVKTSAAVLVDIDKVARAVEAQAGLDMFIPSVQSGVLTRPGSWLYTYEGGGGEREKKEEKRTYAFFLLHTGQLNTWSSHGKANDSSEVEANELHLENGSAVFRRVL